MSCGAAGGHLRADGEVRRWARCGSPRTRDCLPLRRPPRARELGACEGSAAVKGPMSAASGQPMEIAEVDAPPISRGARRVRWASRGCATRSRPLSGTAAATPGVKRMGCDRASLLDYGRGRGLRGRPADRGRAPRLGVELDEDALRRGASNDLRFDRGFRPTANTALATAMTEELARLRRGAAVVRPARASTAPGGPSGPARDRGNVILTSAVPVYSRSQRTRDGQACSGAVHIRSAAPTCIPRSGRPTRGRCR